MDYSVLIGKKDISEELFRLRKKEKEKKKEKGSDKAFIFNVLSEITKKASQFQIFFNLIILE